MPSQALQQSANVKRLQVLIAILFSVVTVVASFTTNLVYVPISTDKVLDLTIVTFVFATMIGGYWMAIPLALVWSIATKLNVDPQYLKWSFWELLLVRSIFAIGLVWCYETAKKLHYMSPYNVYRGMLGGLFIKAIAGLPFEMIVRGKLTGLVLRAETFVLEAALCSVFMALLIKHLREIHILNGVKKKQKGMKNYGHQNNVSDSRAS